MGNNSAALSGPRRFPGFCQSALSGSHKRCRRTGPPECDCTCHARNTEGHAIVNPSLSIWAQLGVEKPWADSDD